MRVLQSWMWQFSNHKFIKCINLKGSWKTAFGSHPRELLTVKWKSICYRKTQGKSFCFVFDDKKTRKIGNCQVQSQILKTLILKFMINIFLPVTFELSYKAVNSKPWVVIELKYKLQDEFDRMEIYLDILCSREVSKLWILNSVYCFQ